MLFQLITALLVKAPGTAQRLEAGSILCDYFGNAGKPGKKVGDIKLQVNQQIRVFARVLPPADGNLLGLRVAGQGMRQEAGRAKSSQQLVKRLRLGFVCCVDVHAVAPCVGLVRQTCRHVQALARLGRLHYIETNAGHRAWLPERSMR